LKEEIAGLALRRAGGEPPRASVTLDLNSELRPGMFSYN